MKASGHKEGQAGQQREDQQREGKQKEVLGRGMSTPPGLIPASALQSAGKP